MPTVSLDCSFATSILLILLATVELLMENSIVTKSVVVFQECQDFSKLATKHGERL